MEIDNLLSIINRKELRNWLQENCMTEKSCWIIVSIKPEPNKIQYLDAVEEALCFGWIDGIKKKISETQLAQRLKEDKQTYENFLIFPDLYKRIRIDTIQSNKKQSELFESRLDKFIENTKSNKMYGAWNDDGRLLDY